MDRVSSPDARMALDRPAPSRLMSQATTAAVHYALDGQRGGHLVDSRLRPAARMVCNDARASGLRVEELLIALKQEWGALLDSHHVSPGDARTDLTSRFITLCIYEFYAAQAPLPRSGVISDAPGLHA